LSTCDVKLCHAVVTPLDQILLEAQKYSPQLNMSRMVSKCLVEKNSRVMSEREENNGIMDIE
jgi:hypothetical protein